MAVYQITLEDGSVYEVETEPATQQDARRERASEIGGTLMGMAGSLIAGMGGNPGAAALAATQNVAGRALQNPEAASQFMRPIAEVGLGTAGAMLGTGAGPYGAAAGGALGLGAGRSLVNSFEQFTGARPPVTSLGDVARETEESLRSGAKVEAGGLAIGVPLRVAGRAFKKLEGPAKWAWEKAKEFGVTLTPAEIRGSKPLALLESLFDKVISSAGVSKGVRDKAAKEFEAAGERLLNELGDSAGAEVSGQMLKKAVQDNYYRRLTIRDKLFDKLTEKVPKDAVVFADNLENAAQSILKNEQQLPLGIQTKEIFSRVGDIAKIREQGLSFQGAKQLRERLNKLSQQYIDEPIGQAYKSLKKALDQDISQFAEASGGQIRQAWSRANRYHGAVKNLMNDPTVSRIVDKYPERVVSAVFRPGNVTNIQMLRKALPKKSWEKFQEAATSKLFEAPGEVPSFVALQRNLRKYDDTTLVSALGEKRTARLKEFVDLANYAKRTTQSAANPSGTGQAVINFGLGGLSLYNMKLGGALLIGTPLAAKMYYSDLGRKLLLSGIKTPITSQAAGRLSAQILSTLQEMTKNE